MNQEGSVSSVFHYNYSKVLDSRQQNSEQTDCTYVHLHNYRVHSHLWHYMPVLLFFRYYCNNGIPIPDFQEPNEQKSIHEQPKLCRHNSMYSFRVQDNGQHLRLTIQRH